VVGETGIEPVTPGLEGRGLQNFGGWPNLSHPLQTKERSSQIETVVTLDHRMNDVKKKFSTD